MGLQYTPHTIPLVLSATIAAVGAVVAWRRRRGKLEVWGTIVQLAVMSWALLLLGIVSVTTESLKLLGVTVFYPHAIATNFSFLVFTLYFVGRDEWLTRGRLVALFSLPFLVLVAGATNEIHGLLYLVEGLDPSGGWVSLDYSLGLLFYLFLVPTYAASALYLGLLTQQFRRSRNVYRAMSAVLFVGLAALTSVSLVSLVGLSPFPHLMLFPYTYLVLGLFLVLGTSSATFLRILPVEEVFRLVHPRYGGTIPTARDVIVQEIDDGIIVLDDEDVVVDINTTAKKMLGADRPVGSHVSTVVPLDRITSDTVTRSVLEDGEVSEFTDEIWVETDGDENRCYDVRVTALVEDDDSRVGHVGLMRDITARKRREQQLREREKTLAEQKADLETQTAQLEHQNERLDKFAGIVSHDLRNPLNVAYGRLTLVEAELKRVDESPVDIEHVEIAENALQRMEAIIDDALSLAREGKAITETDPVDLEANVRRAWQNVDTADATLDVDADVTVESDFDRLLTVFENLFRNAIEHGYSDVTVRVGLLEDGFFIEDDGPGIPDDEKESVLEEGYTTNEDGTGFGLAIVNNIVRAHGWELAVIDSDDGGARFEVTGVSVQTNDEV